MNRKKSKLAKKRNEMKQIENEKIIKMGEGLADGREVVFPTISTLKQKTRQDTRLP